MVLFVKLSGFYRVLTRLTVLFMLCGLEMVFAQDEVKFEHISTDNGLSQNDINTIYQDDHGYLWFGTHDGLNKYDGYGFKVYNPDPNGKNSVSSNLVYTIEGDKEGNLWIGTTGRGLNFFDTTLETFTHFRHDPSDDRSLSNDHVTTVFRDQKDRLWIGTNEGLNMLDLRKPLDSLSFYRFNPEQDPFVTGWDGNSIFAIYEDSRNQVWVGGHGGLYRLSRDQNGDIYFRLVNNSIGLPSITVRSIDEDSEGRLIIGTDGGLYHQMNVAGPVKLDRIHQGIFNDVQVDRKGNIWAGTNSGLCYFERSNESRFPQFKNNYTYDPRNPYSLSKNIVKSMFMDKTGIIWIGTNGGGVNKFDPERKQFRHVKKTLDPSSLSYDKIRSMYEDSNGTLWIGTEGGGLNMLQDAAQKSDYTGFEVFETVLKPFVITERRVKNRKLLFIGAENTPGLFKLDITEPDKIDESKIILIPDISHSVFSLLNDSRENLWIGTYNGGVHRWTPNSEGSFEKQTYTASSGEQRSLSNNIIRDIIEDSNGNIWFATGDGLSRLTEEQAVRAHPKFDVYQKIPNDSTSISHNYVLTLYESQRGEIWVGTFGGGLCKLMVEEDGAIRFHSYSVEDGLPNNVIKAILEDEEGNLWLSTNQGLSRFDPIQEHFKNYDVNDGLQSNEFQELASLKRQNGEMLFGGVNGFNAFFPKDITDNPFSAETVITNFSISNEPVEIGEKFNGRVLLKTPIDIQDEIRLKYWENNFSFEFSSLHYSAPDKNQFAYFLEGFDEDWVYTNSSRRFANYTNLSPGNYTFYVKASNNDGVWDESPSMVSLEVVPPFWLTKWAYLLYGLLILALLWAYRRFTIIRTTEKHQLQLEHLEKEKSDELQRIKLEFFTNISHEFRTPLTLIKGPLEYLQKNGYRLRQNEVEEQYSLMQKNTNYLLKLVNQLLDFRKLNQGKMRLVIRNSDLSTFIRDIGEPFQFLAHKQQINFEIQTPPEDLLTWFDHDALEKVMNNLLSNAFKFTPRHGNVRVSVCKSADMKLPESQRSSPLTDNELVIQVQDSGMGIPKDKVDHIFERYYVERDKKRKNLDGAGIGLSFIKDLIELHQGSISVSSEPQKGTIFTVTLPMNRKAYEGIPEISVKEESDSDFFMRSSEAENYAIGMNDEIEDQGLSRTRSKLPALLIVDDNPDIRVFIKTALADKFTFYEAEDGRKGLEIALAQMPNIILTDIVMPIMDGYELCAQLKTKKETSHIPIVMLTAKSSQESEIEGLKIGADDYIRKPFDMEMLELKLANIIKHREELRKRFNRTITLQPSEITVTSTDEKFLQQAIEIVEKHMMNTDFNVEMLVKEMGLSRSNLYLKFKELTGLSSSEFIRNVRLKRAVQLFEKSDLSVKEIMYMTGFNTASYFSKCFKRQFGVIPSEYVKQVKTASTVKEN